MFNPIERFLRRFFPVHNEEHGVPLRVDNESGDKNGYGAFQYPPNVLLQLRAAWNERGWREPEPEPLPPDSVLRTIVEVAYHASFTAEERRATTFSLVLCAPTEMRHALIFKNPRRFSVEEVRRLAPAADIQADHIGIYAESSGEIRIWGLSSEGAWERPTFVVASPGTIEVRRFERTVFALAAGSVSTSSAIDLHFVNAVFEDRARELVNDFVEARGIMGNAYDPFSFFGTVLFDLLRHAAAHGHGATIFIIPDEDAHSNDVERYLRIKYHCNDSPIWAALRESARGLVYALSLPQDEDAEEQAQAPEMHEAGQHRLNQWPSRVARLTRVDGGVLLTDRYQLLGFGAEVITTADELRTVQLAGGSSEDIEQYGTRHRSAFRLCSRYPKAVAFVCSQDGGIKCVRNMNGAVTLWK